eukprot:350961-Chlamydomonas_euryale.AAC.2
MRGGGKKVRGGGKGWGRGGCGRSARAHAALAPRTGASSWGPACVWKQIPSFSETGPPCRA